MGFLLILTANHSHPTSHLLLITQVIGSEALVEVTLHSSLTVCSTSRTLEMVGRGGGGVEGWRVGAPSASTPTKQAPDGLASLGAAVISPNTHSQPTGGSGHKEGKAWASETHLLPASGDLRRVTHFVVYDTYGGPVCPVGESGVPHAVGLLAPLPPYRQPKTHGGLLTGRASNREAWLLGPRGHPHCPFSLACTGTLSFQCGSLPSPPQDCDFGEGICAWSCRRQVGELGMSAEAEKPGVTSGNPCLFPCLQNGGWYPILRAIMRMK